ncbi:unnamed protein product [Calypogeia fissa]
MEKRSVFFVLLVATLLVGAAECQTNESAPAEFVLVHGAFHGAWCWFRVITKLHRYGFKATALDLSSHGRDKTHADNVTSLAQYAKPLTDYLASNVSGKVVLVGHSLGGISISYAMEQFPDKVSKAIFLAAAMPLNNQSGASSFPPDALPRLFGEHAVISNYGNGPLAPPTSLSPNLTMCTSLFYNKSPPQDATLGLLVLDDEPVASLYGVLYLTASGYGSVRRFYVKTDFDNVLPPSTDQDYIINQNPPEQVFTINGSDHSAFFSKTREFTELIVKISTL